MAAPRSKTRPGCAKGPPASYTSLTFAIQTATNCARSIASRFELALKEPPFPGGPRRFQGCASAVFEPIAEPNRAALQHLGAHQRHRADRCRAAGFLVAGVEDTRRALGAIDGGADRQADLVD